ncbi:stage III sporulation protein AG [Ferviditalea candida]|uniref:Stage III sporulation protein AG n=1 Tax=Ferviditalea candida TaxID=3108399 RepID=A0ABU5ZIC8_9BACL|nr:stage III sporulation protein AG [Paenibacillaceae bacterium T2]
MEKLLQWMENWIGGGPGGAKRVSTFRWLLIIGLTGIMFMILNSFVNVKNTDKIIESKAAPPEKPAREAFVSKGNPQSPFSEYETMYESRLKEILEKIVGVGEVNVMVNIDSTEEIVVEKNRKDTQQVTDEKDQSGATRHVTDVTQDGEVVLYQVSGDQTPIVLKKIKPRIRGVLIVARGAENLTVKKLIVEAVERGLDVPSYRISIVPRKQ